MKELIKKAAAGVNLTREESSQAMDFMLEGRASEIQIASYLTAMAVKGETVDEIVGATQMMREKGEMVHPNAECYMDFVGTGGDGTNTFNISTTAMFICAAAGIKIAKHGNRAASSKSGAADLLEALGAEIFLEPEQVEECINEVGAGFMMAQRFHKAMKNVAPVRKELGIRTMFNMLGPLSNPSGAEMQVIGVFSEDKVRMFARVMKEMGVKRAMVVYGRDGMDEITNTAKTLVNEIKDDQIIEYEIDPKDYGIPYAAPEMLKGGDPETNAKITQEIFSGQKGPKRDIVVMNAAAGLYIGGVVHDYASGIKLAEEMIDSGKALAAMEQFIAKTKSFSKAG